MRPSYALIPAAVPILALIVALPFVNRLEPVVFGLPFLLFWILGWVLSTPAFLVLSYCIARRGSDGAGGDRR